MRIKTNSNTLHITKQLKVDVDNKCLTGFKDGSTCPLHHRGDNRLWAKIFVPIVDKSIKCKAVETTLSGDGTAQVCEPEP